MSYTIFFTGLSGSGKSTLAVNLKRVYRRFLILDSFSIRKGLCKNLGFSIEDRNENVRRIIEVCKILNSNGIPVITALIAPIEKIRLEAKRKIKKCYIIWCKCPLEECKERDVKKLYTKAKEGIIKNFTGIDSPYEEPKYVDLIVNTKRKSVEDCVEKIINFLRKKGRGV